MSGDGGVAVVGSPQAKIGSNSNQGAVYVYSKSGTSWPQTSKLVSNDGAAGDFFGNSVAVNIDGNAVLAGAPDAPMPSHLFQGAAYVFYNTSPVTVTTNPTDQTAVVGSTATFTAEAAGAPSPTIQWQVSTDGGSNFTNIAGATQNWLTVTPSFADSNKQYRALFDNNAGSAVTTSPATLTVVRQSTVLTVSSNANPRPIGGTLNFTVTAASANGIGTPNGGQVDIYFGTLFHYSGTLVNGKAVFKSIPVAAVGTYQVGVTYGGDFNFGQASATMIQVVSKGSSTLTGTVPTQATAGQPVAITGVLTYSGTTQPPYGGVMVMDNGQPINYVQLATSGGTTSATYTTSTLSVGDHYIRLIYFGNPETLAASSDIYHLVITAGAAAAASSAPPAFDSAGSAPPAVGGLSSTVGGSLTSSAGGFSTQAQAVSSQPVTVTSNPVDQTVVLGTTATFTASAVATSQLSVQWQASTDGGSTFNNIAGATQSWLTVTPSLADSNNQYRAVFLNYLGSYAPTTAATLTVVRQSSVLTITSNVNPRPIGATLDVTVNVASANGVGTPNGGQVDIYFGTLFHYSGTLVNGKAVFKSIPVAAVGTYQVGVTYGGDANFNWSQATMSQVVTKGSSTLTGTVPTQATAGQPVAITGVLTYSGTTQPPYGGVVVMDNGQPINYVQLATSGGTTSATYTTSTLSVGTHYIRLIYFGNPETEAASTADIYTLVITAAGANALTAVAGTPSGAATSATSAIASGAVAIGTTPKSSTVSTAALTAPKAAVQPKIAVAAPRASAARVLQQRFTVAYKTR